MSSLLDQPPFTAAELRELDARLAQLLGTANDIVVVQAEAIVTLEAVAKSIAAPDAIAVNIVTGPYGALFGQWMTQSGATVIDIVTDFDGVVSADEVEAVLDANPGVTVLALVHAEAATGGTNPAAAIAKLAAARGIVTVLDAVASIGAEPVSATEWGIDITVIGGQKSLAGPAGVSAAAISERAWNLIEANPAAPRGSFLSLLDLRDTWVETDHSVIPGTPNTLESRALLQALTRVLDGEGLESVIDRHTRAARATRAALAPLGLVTWQHGPDGFAPVVTAVRLLGANVDEQTALGGIVSQGNGALAGQLVRVNHTGRNATLDAVLGAVDQLARAVRASDPISEQARAAATAAWAQD
jgi:aspartate aminotransferase-like enzyme